MANKNSSGTITGYTVFHHITDHLGSVRAITNASTGNVVETSDFLPFGTRWSLTAGSSSSTLTDATNRWRYSGKEEQKAINSSLPFIDYGARMYDPTIARWMSVDPMAEKYYPLSPYGYCAGNPVRIIDPTGCIIRIFYKEGDATKYVVYSGKVEGKVSNDYVKSVIKAYHYNKNNWRNSGYSGESPLAELVERSDVIFSIRQDEDNSGTRFVLDEAENPTIYWNSNEGSLFENGVVSSPATLLAHEADHANDYMNDAKSHDARFKQKDSSYGNKEERRVIEGSEQKTARANGEIKGKEVTRRTHNGKTVIVSGGPTSTTIDIFETAAYETHYQNKIHW